SRNLPPARTFIRFFLVAGSCPAWVAGATSPWPGSAVPSDWKREPRRDGLDLLRTLLSRCDHPASTSYRKQSAPVRGHGFVLQPHPGASRMGGHFLPTR